MDKNGQKQTQIQIIEIRTENMHSSGETWVLSLPQAIVLEEIAKFENARYLPGRTRHVRWTPGDDLEGGKNLKLGKEIVDLMKKQ